MSVVISPLSFLILIIRILSLCPLVSLAKCLFILLVFSKNQLLALLILCIVLSVSTWLISALSLMISCHLLLLGVFASFCSRAFRCPVKLLVYALQLLFGGTQSYEFSSYSLCPVTLGTLRLHFHQVLKSLSFLYFFLDQVIIE